MKLMVSACLLGTCCRYDGGGYDPMIFQNRLKKCTLVPVCPEQLGGLPTPRSPAERVGEHVRNCEGADVTAAFFAGASAALELAQREGCRCALLKERSPSLRKQRHLRWKLHRKAHPGRRSYRRAAALQRNCRFFRESVGGASCLDRCAGVMIAG